MRRMDRSGIVDRLLVEPKAKAGIAGIDPGSTKGAPGDKEATKAASAELNEELVGLQARLWAEHRGRCSSCSRRWTPAARTAPSARCSAGSTPQGCRVTSFKAPTEEELAHDFLWRIHTATPGKGEIGIFNRSHYEDVLVVRVHELVTDKAMWRAPLRQINAFEAHLAAQGTTIVKFFLHISEGGAARSASQDRIDDPDEALEVLAGRPAGAGAAGTTTRPPSPTPSSHDQHGGAPWYVVPADHKWYRDWAVLSILVETLRTMDPQYPAAEDGRGGVVVAVTAPIVEPGRPVGRSSPTPCPTREAIVCGDRRLTYATGRRPGPAPGARVLDDAGVRPGDFVGLHLRNCTEYLEAMLAAFVLRAVPVNVNYRYVADELRYLFDDAGLVGLVTSRPSVR